MDLNARGSQGATRRRVEREHAKRQSRRGTGVLNNEMYIGRLVWNRLRYAKDPEMVQRRSRANANEAVVAIEASELAIVPRELWEAVKARQAALEKKGAIGDRAGDAPEDAPSRSGRNSGPAICFPG